MLAQTKNVSHAVVAHALANGTSSAERSGNNGTVKQGGHRSLTRRQALPATDADIGIMLETSVSFDEILCALYFETARLVDASNFALALHNDCTNTLEFVLVFERGEMVKPRSLDLAKSGGFVGHAFTIQEPVLVQDLHDSGILAETDPLSPEKPVRSWLSVPVRNPLLNGRGVRGAIMVWSDKPQAFTKSQCMLLSALGAQAAIAVENARMPRPVLDECVQATEMEHRIRRVLADDLHDGPIQLVSGIQMRLDYCRKAIEKDPSLLSKEFDYLQGLCKKATHQMRTLLFGLKPVVLETQGLCVALKEYLERRQAEVATTKLELNVATSGRGEALSRLNPRVEAGLFTIVREAVNNALKHANATRIEVKLEDSPQAIQVRVFDDGNGFDIEKNKRSHGQKGNLGLMNIYERAASIGGRVEIKSEPDQGTQIIIRVPKAR